MNPKRKNRSGFTLMEVLITTALIGGILLLSARWFKSGNSALQQSLSVNELHMEAATAADLFGNLLNGAEPASFQLSSTDDGPWSQLSFASGTHHYTFSASKHRLLFTRDNAEPKVLTDHLIGLHFAFDRNTFPTLLRWSIRLSDGPSSREEVYFSGVQYIGRPAE